MKRLDLKAAGLHIEEMYSSLDLLYAQSQEGKTSRVKKKNLLVVLIAREVIRG